jgi:AraC family transcriptional regulator
MARVSRVVHRCERVTLARVACDGVDTPRPAVEPVRGDRLVVVLRGAFELRGGRRVIADPTRAFVLRDGAEHVFRHPSGGGDVCLSVSGPTAARLAARGPAVRAVDVRAWTTLRTLATGGGGDALAIEAALEDALGVGDEPPSDGRARALADEVAFLVQRRLDRAPLLSELARVTGVSEFHLCRAFRRATGRTIGAFYREVRLRHALALVLDTRRPIAEIAHATGFASHAHLTAQFRARFGVAPRRARQSGLAQSGIDCPRRDVTLPP